MAYFDYHAVAKRLIRRGHLVRTEYVGVWNGISPALVLFLISMPLCLSVKRDGRNTRRSLRRTVFSHIYNKDRREVFFAVFIE